MSAYQSTGRASRHYFHREYVNQFLTKELASGDRLANIDKNTIKKLPTDVFSYENCVIAEKVAKIFYSAAAFDLGEPPKFFSGEFSAAAAMFLARVFAAREYTPRRGIYDAAPDVHDAFVNAWLCARAHGEQNDAYDALCHPWECIPSAIRRSEDMFICEAVRCFTSLTATAINTDAIMETVAHKLRQEEPMLCAGLH
jgi:hypothetical protein